MSSSPPSADSALAAHLRRDVEGEVMFDSFSRGRYATDASIYQIEPVGVVIARSEQDIQCATAIAREHGVPVLPRGAGTSQCGQTVGEALVIDTSKHMNRILSVDAQQQRVRVQPGIVLDQLNAQLRSTGLHYPVDVSPANRATIGGMTGNNSCGSRSIRYGNMVHNVQAVRALLADGTIAEFGPVPGNFTGEGHAPRYIDLVQRMRELHTREADEIARRFPTLLRRVGGYNIDTIDDAGHNMSHLLVGSEGTLGFFTEVELKLAKLPRHRALGICHFSTFYQAMDATQHIVKLDPSAVEVVDRTLMDLAHEIDMFRPTLERFVQGTPDALLLVEFAGEDEAQNLQRLRELGELLADLGYPGSVVEATDPAAQNAVWDVRKAGLNIMMSMKGDGKPVSFVEDCAVPLEDLAEYTRRLDDVFARHDTKGTWYAHASVGTLHVRPIINLKQDQGAAKMRAIAEEAFEMVREYKGSHSGEHGDGLVRSEFHEAMFGKRIVSAFETVKDTFDPDGLFNPGKIVRPERMDDRSLMRYMPGYAPIPIETQLDWSAWGGLNGAVEMCNNNGTCRKSDPGVMCPSYRVTGDEKHVTRGRANSLRLALTGQLGADAFTSQEMYDTMDLCVGCKGCKRECPTGVDMARMKTEFLHHYHNEHGLPLSERLVAWLPRYAPFAATFAPLFNLRNRVSPLAWLQEKLLGFDAKRPLPEWRSDWFRDDEAPAEASDLADSSSAADDSKDVVLLADTFNRWFEPENLRAALQVLRHGGYRVHLARAPDKQRPLCCGRTFLASGQTQQARVEAQRMIDVLLPHARLGRPIIGLEPSCLFTLRDEFSALLPGGHTETIAANAMLLEEFLAREDRAGRLKLPLHALGHNQVLLHGHCHQKAFAVMSDVERTLRLIPDLEVETVETSCCGMAGAFGYQARHADVSQAMAEADLLPAVRRASSDTLVVADGTSCRHQIEFGSERHAIHVVQVLADAIRSS